MIQEQVLSSLSCLLRVTGYYLYRTWGTNARDEWYGHGSIGKLVQDHGHCLQRMHIHAGLCELLRKFISLQYIPVPGRPGLLQFLFSEQVEHLTSLSSVVEQISRRRVHLTHFRFCARMLQHVSFLWRHGPGVERVVQQDL